MRFLVNSEEPSLKEMGLVSSLFEKSHLAKMALINYSMLQGDLRFYRDLVQELIQLGKSLDLEHHKEKGVEYI